ncbi:hypothetical protein ANN_12097 [Periplaneta americana]|uniref:Uncharacterized protein n=1 Tax=Periplaneta americana TaxID=6978 RepID=A0ABQ8T8E4_PERAM|nr:hypothetical protein ANN_12097 [Periplaneta americana]
MIMSRDENIVRNGNIKIGNLSFEQVEKFKYLGATVTNINDTREEIIHRINRGNACYYSVEKLLSSNLLSKNLKVRIYKTVILPVVLYGCETWTLTLREEHRLRVFENKMLRKIFGAKRDEVTGEWKKLHNTELHALYSSPDIIRNTKSRCLRWAGHVARMGESRNAYKVLVGRPEDKRPLGRPRRRWADNIKIDLREVGYDDREWINLAQDRDQRRAYVRAAMNLRAGLNHESLSHQSIVLWSEQGSEISYGYPVFATSVCSQNLNQRLTEAGIGGANVAVRIGPSYDQQDEARRYRSRLQRPDHAGAHPVLRVAGRFEPGGSLPPSHKPPSVPILCKINPPSIIISHLPQINFNIILPSTSRLPQRFGRQCCAGSSFVPGETYPQRQCPDRNLYISITVSIGSKVSDQWLGRGGPIFPRSPDLNPLDFYLWGHLKSLVYSSPVPDLESLRNRTVACSEDIVCLDLGSCSQVKRFVSYSSGGHFEHLL